MIPPVLDAPILGLLRVHFTQSLAEVLLQSHRGLILEDAWDQIRDALQAMPLGTDQFAVALHRLNNVRCYLEEGEHGAALYEVRLLRPLINGQ
jgi:hypothetical protein